MAKPDKTKPPEPEIVLLGPIRAQTPSFTAFSREEQIDLLIALEAGIRDSKELEKAFFALRMKSISNPPPTPEEISTERRTQRLIALRSFLILDLHPAKEQPHD